MKKEKRGPGRPTIDRDKKKKGIYVKLPPYLIDLLDVQGDSRAITIEKAVNFYINFKRQNTPDVEIKI